MKHWAENLEDRGKIVNNAISNIKITQEELARLQARLKREEEAFMELIAAAYSEEEILKAKSIHNLTNQ